MSKQNVRSGREAKSIRQARALDSSKDPLQFWNDERKEWMKP
jgi:hypothetical protein